MKPQFRNWVTKQGLRELVLNGQVLADFVKVFIEYSAPKSTPVYEKILWRDDDDVD